MYIKACVFKRVENSEWEGGIRFESKSKGKTSIHDKIIDRFGYIQSKVYDVKDKWFDMCICTDNFIDNLGKPHN